jgi:hypothetical protein
MQRTGRGAKPQTPQTPQTPLAYIFEILSFAASAACAALVARQCAWAPRAIERTLHKWYIVRKEA